jgi:hypothetical protein
MSEAGAENTIIDGENAGQIISIINGQDTTFVVDGFTIANGRSGIWVDYCGATIRNCIFYGNSGSNGAAILCRYTDPHPVISNCVFYHNVADYRGGGIFSDQSSAKIRDCVFYDNSVVVGGGSNSYGGGAINVHYASPTAIIRRCTMIPNSSVSNGGAINMQSSDGADVYESVIVFSTEGPGIHGWAGTVSQCIIFGNAGGDALGDEPDNLYVDPLLCAIDLDDFTLCSNSPCLSDKNAWDVHVGTLGQGCGDCVAATENSAWGRFKTMFR